MAAQKSVVPMTDRSSQRLLVKMYQILIASLLFVGFCTSSALATYQNPIVRPCHPITEECVRENLAANSRCSTNGLRSLPSSYNYGTLKFYTPYFNCTYVDNDLVYKNHDKCFISEFFYNTKTDVAVLTVDCPGLIISSNRTVIQHASAKEDTIYSFASNWEYPLIRLTVNIQRANAMDICSSFVFTDVTQMPKFIVSPNDKPTKNYLSRDLSYMPIYEREATCHRGNHLLRAYISTTVCNFGCFN